MNLITGKHVSRRMLLRGAGVALGLPMLEAMRPALAAATGGKAAAQRLAVVYVPNGIVMNQWLPEKTGAGFEFTRILKPLETYREDIVVVSGLSNHAAVKAKGGGHAKASGSFLSSAPPKYTAGADVRAGVTFDQVAAQKFAEQTRVASLQIGCEDSRMIGNCDTGSSCAYTNSPVVEERGDAPGGGSESAVGIRAAVRDGGPEPGRGDEGAAGAVQEEHSGHDAGEHAATGGDAWGRRTSGRWTSI
jgi:hypothetical protein